MKKILVLLTALLMVACQAPKTELVDIYKGDPGLDGSSCSVSQLEEGALISCTDGTSSLIVNGSPGKDGQNCKVNRNYSGATIICPNQWPVTILDGEDGRDGASCSSERQEQQERVKITCKRGTQVVSTSYVYDGEKGDKGNQGPAGATGPAGKSCTAIPAQGGVNVKCGNDAPVFLANGTNGTNGSNGQNGVNGQDGDDAFTPGLSCSVHDLKSWDANTSLPQALVNNPSQGVFSLAALNIPDSQASAGFPGMPTALQNKVGLEGYILDCSGYLNVDTSGDYVLKLLSDDGSELRINDQLVINNQGLHAPQTVTSAVTRLNRGQNRINVLYYQGPYTQIALELKYSGPNTAEQVIPASKLTH